MLSALGGIQSTKKPSLSIAGRARNYFQTCFFEVKSILPLTFWFYITLVKKFLIRLNPIRTFSGCRAQRFHVRDYARKRNLVVVTVFFAFVYCYFLTKNFQTYKLE